MATHAPMPRVPFAPVDSSRLQQLASAKNRQNGLFMPTSPLDAKANSSSLLSKPGLFSPAKRPFEPAIFEDVDSENVDPAALCSPSKKSKSVSESVKPYKPFTFAMSPSASMPPPPTIPSRVTTPARPNMSSPRAPLTAPAGRSPKRKAIGQKSRRVSAPFSRIDPPFSSRNDTGLPFSLDAALSGTFAKPTPNCAGATIQESMPKNWFFDIYEDTREEEAATLMEHSTLTLDLSSDEESRKQTRHDRGKENTPPEDYDAPTASRSSIEAVTVAPTRVKKTDIIRQKVASDAMDDGQRSPLSDLETDYFIPDGLDKTSQVIVAPTPEKSTTAISSQIDGSGLFAAPVAFTAGSSRVEGVTTPSKRVYDMPIVTADGDVKGDIIVWEDSPSSMRSLSPTLSRDAIKQSTTKTDHDENSVEDAVEL